MYEVTVISEWAQVNSGYEMRAAVDYPAEWTDVTGQIDVALAANEVVCLGRVSAALYTALQSDPHVILLDAAQVENEP